MTRVQRKHRRRHHQADLASRYSLLSPRIRRLDLEPLEDRRMLALLPFAELGDTISPNWVVESEDLGLRVTVNNPNTIAVTLDTNSLLEMPGITYSAALPTAVDVPAESDITLVFQQQAIPTGTLGNQTPRLNLNGTDALGDSYNCVLDLTSNVIDVQANGAGLIEAAGIPFHPQTPSVEHYYPVDFYIENGSADEIVLDTSTRVEFFAPTGQRALVTLPVPATIAGGETYNLLFSDPFIGFGELPLGTYTPTLVCSGTKAGAPFSQVVQLASTVTPVTPTGGVSIGAGPSSGFLVVNGNTGGTFRVGTSSANPHTHLAILDWSDYGDVVQIDDRRSPTNDLWIEDTQEGTLTWLEGRADHDIYVSPGPGAEYGVAYEGRPYITTATPLTLTGGSTIQVGVILNYTFVFDDEINLHIDDVVASASVLDYDTPIEIDVHVSNLEGYPVDVDYAGVEPATGLILSDFSGRDISDEFEVVPVNNPVSVPAQGTAIIHYQLIPNHSLPFDQKTFVDARVQFSRQGVYQGGTLNNKVTIYGSTIASEQGDVGDVILGGTLVDAGPDVRLYTGETYEVSGGCADPAPDTWSATVDYGTGLGPQSLTIAPDLTFELSEVYSQSGRHAVTVSVDDGHGRTGVEQVIVDVFDVLYVDAGATGDNSGVTWANAFNNLDAALDVAVAGQEIWVASGTYTPASGQSFVHESGVEIYGGFLGGEQFRSERDIDGNPPATLEGNGNRVLTAVDLSETAIIDGLTITNGYTEDRGGGAGIYVSNSRVTVRNNQIVNNRSIWKGAGICADNASSIVIADNRIAGNLDIPDPHHPSYTENAGGGIWCGECSSITIRGNTLEANQGKFGGAIGLYQSPGVVEANRIINNSASWGAGIYVTGNADTLIIDNDISDNSASFGAGMLGYYCSAVTISGNAFDSNQATWGGGIALYWSSITVAANRIERNIGNSGGGGVWTHGSELILAGNLICRNVANAHGGGGGIILEGGSIAELSNNTIAGNVATEGNRLGGGIRVLEDSIIESSVGNIIWGNTAPVGDEIAVDATSSLAMDYSDINLGGVHVEPGGEFINGPFVMDADPLFADSATGDYHLKSEAGRFDLTSGSWVVDAVSSPCIDAGDPGQAVGGEPAPNGARVNMGAFGGTAEASKTLSFSVVDLVVGTSGFVAQFNGPLNAGELNLYDVESGTLGPADVTVVGDAVGPIPGSLVVKDDSVRFVATGGLLSPDTYTVTLRSAADGFRYRDSGDPLDGDGDGTPGADFTTRFTVGPHEAIVVSLPDFSRGPEQQVRVPATNTGLPLTLSEAAGVERVRLTIDYDPALLTITGATVGPDTPANATVNTILSVPGNVTLDFSSPTPLDAGAADFITLQAEVSTDAPYGAAHVLDIHSATVNDGSLTATPDDAIHTVAYLGDTTGNRGYSGLDAQRVARVTVGLDGGFAAYPVFDPVVVADATRNGSLSALDAQRIAQVAVGLDPDEIPPLPGGGMAPLRVDGSRVTSDGRVRSAHQNPGGDAVAASGAQSAPYLLTNAQLAPVVEAAVALVGQASPLSGKRDADGGTAGSALRDVTFEVVDLPGDLLGLAGEGTIQIDVDAAGYGWFIEKYKVQSTKDEGQSTKDKRVGIFIPHSEFRIPHCVDLLTVVLHELGHILGHDHEAEGLMAETLTPGTRRLPDGGFLASLDGSSELMGGAERQTLDEQAFDEAFAAFGRS